MQVDERLHQACCDHWLVPAFLKFVWRAGSATDAPLLRFFNAGNALGTLPVQRVPAPIDTTSSGELLQRHQV
jgi:hypothetical protein